MMLSWQPSDPIYRLLDIVSALCRFSFYQLSDLCDPKLAESCAGSSAKERRKKKKLRRGFFESLRRGPWKNHCRSDLAGEREVTLVLQPHRVITAGAAALCLFSTDCDTDGFDRRGAQSGGPRVGGWGGLGRCECSNRREGRRRD